MLSLLLAACLNSAGPAAEPPDPAAAEETPKPAAKPHRKLPTPSVPSEDPGTVVPRPKRALHPPHPPVAPATPAPAADPTVLDRRLIHLEEENARLRMQLTLAGTSAPGPSSDPAAALGELQAGNQRFVTGTRVRTLLSGDDPALRQKLAKADQPFAVVITCSDSRLSESLLFDQELGRLFAIREAGNSLDNLSLGSVEFALDRLGAKLVVVLGHLDCAAVQIVRDAHGKPLTGNLWALQAAMSGLLEDYPEDPNEEPEVHLTHLVERNAQRQAQALLDRSDLVRGLVARKKVEVVPAVYDPATGKVSFLPALGK
jgi:carbonic anhydrase